MGKLEDMKFIKIKGTKFGNLIFRILLTVDITTVKSQIDLFEILNFLLKSN